MKNLITLTIASILFASCSVSKTQEGQPIILKGAKHGLVFGNSRRYHEKAIKEENMVKRELLAVKK
jgi:hypothetical protein